MPEEDRGLEDLPPEILCSITGLVSVKDKMNLRLVSKRLYKGASLDPNFKTLHMSLDSGKHQCGSLRTREMLEMSDMNISLKFNDVSKYNISLIKELADRIVEIRFLTPTATSGDISHESELSKDLENITLQNLKSLAIDFPLSIGVIKKFQAQLEVLEINWKCLIPVKQLDGGPQKPFDYLPALRKLKLDYCYLGDWIWKLLARYKDTLSHLCLNIGTNTDPFAPQSEESSDDNDFESLPRLTDLWISRILHYDDIRPLFNQATNVRNLSLTSVQLNCLAVPLPDFPFLRTLCVSQCSDFHNLKRLLDKCSTSLISLQVHACSNSDSGDMTAPRLQSLNLIGDPGRYIKLHQVPGLIASAATCLNTLHLNWLDLSRLDKIDQELSALKNVIVSECIGNRGINNLLSKCSSNLERLLVTDTELKITDMPKLRILHLIGCKVYHLDSVLTSCSSTLETLMLYGSADGADLAKINTSLPNLKSLALWPKPTDEIISTIQSRCSQDVQINFDRKISVWKERYLDSFLVKHKF